MEEVIADRFHRKLKENQDANSITEAAVLKVTESGEIRDL